MPAKSKSQQRLMAMALHNPDAISEENRGVLSMSDEDKEHFARTPRKGLPRHVRKSGRKLSRGGAR